MFYFNFKFIKTLLRETYNIEFSLFHWEILTISNFKIITMRYDALYDSLQWLITVKRLLDRSLLDRSRNESKSERVRTTSRARSEIDKWLRASGGY